MGSNSKTIDANFFPRKFRIFSEFETNGNAKAGPRREGVGGEIRKSFEGFIQARGVRGGGHALRVEI
jgi:hypothetical protein